MKRQLKDLFSSLKPRRSMTFLAVIIGAAVGSQFKFEHFNWQEFVCLFFLFQLLQGAIYIINDIVDYPDDTKNPLLVAKRPIASGRMSINKAKVYVLFILLIVGLLGYLFIKQALPFFLGFLLFNLIYTIWLNKVVYLDGLANGLTYTGRVFMGMYLFGGHISLAVTAAMYLLSANLGILRRLKEKRNHEPGRATLDAYSFQASTLICAVLCCLALLLIPFTPKLNLPILLFLVLVNVFIAVSFFRNRKTARAISEVFNFF